MFDTRGLIRYIVARYKERTESIFLDGLVGGMFLSFLLDDEDKCDDKVFVKVFFYIGLAHFLSKIVTDLGHYSASVGGRDGVRTFLEKSIANGVPYVLHVIKLIQYPLLLVLTYHVVKIRTGNWTNEADEKGENGKKYCDKNTINIAVITVIFQFLLGLLTIGSWTYLWSIDSDDDNAEKIEEQQWKEEEAKTSKNLWGKIKMIVLICSMESFFDSGISGTFLSLAISLPKDKCNIPVMEWFLFAGVVATLTDVINILREEIQALLMLDGIINKAEHRLLGFLRMVIFPLFLMEFICFLSIVTLVFQHIGNIVNVSDKAKREDGSLNPDYCEKGPWKLMCSVVIIYFIVLVFRMTTLLGSFWGVDVDKKTQTE